MKIFFIQKLDLNMCISCVYGVYESLLYFFTCVRVYN